MIYYGKTFLGRGGAQLAAVQVPGCFLNKLKELSQCV